MVQIRKGDFLVHLLNESSRNAILNMRQQHFDGKPFVVAPWSVNMQLGENEVSQVPVWVQFPELPLKYWNPKVLCKLASQLRVPLDINPLTKQKVQGNFARMLVKMGICEKLKDSVNYLNEFGRKMTQMVKYE